MNSSISLLIPCASITQGTATTETLAHPGGIIPASSRCSNRAVVPVPPSTIIYEYKICVKG